MKTICTAQEAAHEEATLVRRLTEANAEAAELVAELEESKERLERSNHNLAAANARSAELLAELQSQREELEWANANLKEAFEENKRLLGIAAHDIRSGVGAIAATAELLCEVLRHSADPGVTEAELIHKESRRLLEFLEGLLDKSRAELGQIKIRPTMVDVATIIQDSIRAHEGLARRKIQTIEANRAGDLPAVLADPVRTRQVLDNLLSNAIKFSPLGGHIAVEMRGLDDFVEVAVNDEGPGLTKTDLDKVFSEFAQLSAKPTANEQSHGLGLSIVKNIVQLHGGRVWAENRADRTGARFCFTLPALRKSPAKRVLAVDDQALNRHLLKKLLESSGHTVETCRSGAEAVEAVKAREFDLVFMDVEMPDMDGLQATKLIRSTGRDEAHLPIIAVTAHTDADHLSLCLDCGMNDTIQKPVDKGILEQVVAKWTPRHSHSLRTDWIPGPQGERPEVSISR
jgi:signal transduction histidine kinase/ActR/RegA family two-component response regulator